MEYIEPTASSRRNLIVVLAAGFGAVLLLALFRDELVASALAKVQALPRCEGIEVFRWSALAFVGIGVAFVGWGSWLAFKMRKFDQWPLPGTWVLRRTPIRRGRVVRLRAYAIWVLAVIAVGVGARSLYFLEKSVDRMRAHNCSAQAQMQPNKSLERTVKQGGRTVRAFAVGARAGAQWRSRPAVQRNRYASS